MSLMRQTHPIYTKDLNHFSHNASRKVGSCCNGQSNLGGQVEKPAVDPTQGG